MLPIAADDIALLYRLFLDRSAATEEVDRWRQIASIEALRERFLDSAEFHGIMRRRGVTLAKAPAPPRLTVDLPPPQLEWQADPATQARLLDHVMRTWTALGHDKPHWSVLSAEKFMPEQIEENRRAFYASGADDAARILLMLERHGRTPAMHPRVVEYGCGVGRVTPYLAKHFATVTAIDISDSHLAMAQEAAREAGAANAGFRLARAPEFGMTEPFDLWFSYIVLQHNPPPVIALVLRRALAMLAPGGIAMFQVPTYAIGYRFNLATYLAAPTNTGTIEVHCLPQPVVFQIAAEAGCVPLEVREDTAMGPPSHWLSNIFVFAKPH